MRLADATSRDTPLAACSAFAVALGAADLAQATACFAREACLITPDATAVHGREDIGLVLVQLAALGIQVQIDSSSSLEAGGAALVQQRWTISMRAPDGEPFIRLTDPTFVLRHVEKEWKLAIAAPWGPRASAFASEISREE